MGIVHPDCVSRAACVVIPDNVSDGITWIDYRVCSDLGDRREYRCKDISNSCIVASVPLLTLAIRNLYVFKKRLKNLDDPVQYNQIQTLMITIVVLIIFGLSAVLPWGREYPLSHFGNLLNAFILSYAVLRHKLIDIRIVIREGTAWLSLATLGVISYWLVLIVFHSVFDFPLRYPVRISF